MTTITFQGTSFQTIGKLPAIGTTAPNFTLTNTDLDELHLKDFQNRKLILNIFPSLDTPTCAMSVKQFNASIQSKPNVSVLCISADLPFAAKRFCTTNGYSNVHPLSVFRHPEFGLNYGVTIIDGPLRGLLSRAVIAIDETGKVLYTEQVPEITKEPNYAAAMAVVM